LEALRQAVALDPVRYATHEEWKYPTQAILGAGGMGCAFLCREPVKGNRPVVVKTFWRAAPGAVEATFAEAMTMDRVGRGHVPALLGYGFAPGGERPYIVMDYLDGYRDGEAWLAEQGPLPLAAGLDLGRRVLQALVVAHAAGVVHLDLKPANLLIRLRSAGEGIAVRVIDFGLARVAERVDAARVPGASRAGLSVLGTGIAGTWDYAPPEQLGQTRYGPPGPRSDLYAFGATWWRLLTGRHPNNRRAKYLPPGCPAALFELIHDLLEHDPKDRPESAAAVLAQLDAIVPVAAAPERDAPARPKPPPAPPIRVVSPPRTATPPAKPSGVPSEVPDIHGWPAAKVLALQKTAADALGLSVVFRDPFISPVELSRSFLVRIVWTVVDHGPEMVVIPAGRFLMGSPDKEVQRSGDEGPQHLVTISRPFAIGRYAVTVGEYNAFCVATGRDKPGDQGLGRGRHPVINVTWNDAVAYCQWLSEQTGRSYRLPTEAEWEYACRAGTATAFHFGATVTTDQANYNGNHPYDNGAKGRYREQTVPVGSLPPNPWGLCEVHGNVWEWCQDWFGGYEAGLIADPGGPATGERRVLRGGSWVNEARRLRSAYRDHDAPGDRGPLGGFRLALGPELRQAKPAG